MLVHVVIWRLKETDVPGVKQAQAERIRALLSPLAALVPGMSELHIGINNFEGDLASDVILYSEFDSLDSLKAYQMHPQHIAAAQAVALLVCERRVVDYYK